MLAQHYINIPAEWMGPFLVSREKIIRGVGGGGEAKVEIGGRKGGVWKRMQTSL